MTQKEKKQEIEQAKLVASTLMEVQNLTKINKEWSDKYNEMRLENIDIKDIMKSLNSENKEHESSRKGFELQIEGLRKDLEKTKEQKDELGASLNTIEAENTELKAAVIKQAKLLCKDV